MKFYVSLECISICRIHTKKKRENNNILFELARVFTVQLQRCESIHHKINGRKKRFDVVLHCIYIKNTIRERKKHIWKINEQCCLPMLKYFESVSRLNKIHVAASSTSIIIIIIKEMSHERCTKMTPTNRLVNITIWFAIISLYLKKLSIFFVVVASLIAS